MDPIVYPDRATIERRDGALVCVRVPYTGDLDGGLRRRASVLLRARLVDGVRVRAVAITLEPGCLIVAMAGLPESIGAWAASGKLARAASLAITEAYDQDHRQGTVADVARRFHVPWRRADRSS